MFELFQEVSSLTPFTPIAGALLALISFLIGVALILVVKGVTLITKTPFEMTMKSFAVSGVAVFLIMIFQYVRWTIII